jgi:hypothetical protein
MSLKKYNSKVSGMRFFIAFLVCSFMMNENVKANAFTEIFGSEGASGIKNPKIRSLSYAFQYLTLTGSIGYVAKQLHDSSFFSPLNLTPDSISNLSPLGYKDYFQINTHNANHLAVKASVDEINLINNFKNELTNNKFSFSSIEFRNNGNFSKNIYNLDERDQLIERYIND